MKKKKNLNISIPTPNYGDFLADIEYLKKYTRTNKSWVVREAVRRYANKIREAV